MTADGQSNEKIIIGRTEYLDLPDWHIKDLLARVDTGAKSSALHVEQLTELPDNKVIFNVVLSNGRKKKFKRIIADVVRWSKVKSSSGHFNNRCFVRTRVRLGPVVKEIEISLDSREDMAFRMLLGRSALRPEFLVDVAKQHAFGGKKKPAAPRPKRRNKP